MSFAAGQPPPPHPMLTNQPLLRDAIPHLADELTQLLTSAGETDLAAQVVNLRIVNRCPCSDDFCATFYTAQRPQGAWGPGHSCVALNPEKGYLILDLIDRKIVSVEVLYREDIRGPLRVLFP